jgi:hypothetical protein
MSETLLPPWVRPVSPEHVAPQDDQTTSFEAALGRAPGQVQSWADPRWQIKREFKSVRGDERAALRAALAEARGRGRSVRATVYDPQRGGFPGTELVTNGTFASGTTGFTATAEHSLSVSDRVLRVKRAQVVAAASVSGPALTGLTQYAPYACRVFARTGRGSSAQFRAGIVDAVDGAALGSTISTDGLSTFAYVLNGTTATPVLQDVTALGAVVANDYFLVPFVSFSQCMLADNAPNMLTHSEQFDDSSWSKTNSTVTADAVTSPDGTGTGDALNENTTNGLHQIQQSVTVASTGLDYAFSVAVVPSNRSWVQVLLSEGSGSTTAGCYFNSSTGAVGTGAVGANWARLRTFVKSLGNGWYVFTIVARKTNAATTISAVVQAASGNGTNSYAGTGTQSAVSLWRATLSQSSVPSRLSSTTTTANATGTGQSGAGLYVKGLTASTSELLKADDWIDWNGELKQLTAALDSDAAGLGYLQFRPLLAGSPADNDPVIVNQPLGRFKLMNSYEYDNEFGLYMDATVELTETFG